MKEIRYIDRLRNVLASINMPILSLFLYVNQQLEKIMRYCIKRSLSKNNYSQESEQRAYKKLSNYIGAERMSEPMVRNMKRLNIPLPASFAVALSIRSVHRSYDITLPEWKLAHKPTGKKFIDTLGIKSPKVYQEYVTMEQIEFTENVVIKPERGTGHSFGVYIYKNDGEIYDLKEMKKYTSGVQFQEVVRSHLRSGKLKKNSWIVEEYVDNDNGYVPADLKFYTFYGVVGLILEVQQQPEKRYCFWNTNGEMVETGKYYTDKQFTGNGVSTSEIEKAAMISREIPAPFIRIDFLRGKDDIYFCEFAPSPGNYHKFNKTYDRYLGQLYVEAEARLLNDLLNGKNFNVKM